MKASVTILLCFLLALRCAQAGTFEDGVAAYEKEQFAKALELWLPLAQQGHRAAQYNVAVLYEKSQGVEQDYVQAARWYGAAAQQGDLEAQYALAVLYENGSGVAQDVEEARRRYRALIENTAGDTASLVTKERARLRLAALHDTGPGVTSRAPKQKVIEYGGGRFVIVESSTGACVIALHGKITANAARRFDDVVRETTNDGCADSILLLESPGGLLFDSLDMGVKVRQAGFRTVVRASCASACGLLFMAGSERTLLGPRAAIGLHQQALDRGNLTVCDTTTYTDAARDIVAYITKMIPARAD